MPNPHSKVASNTEFECHNFGLSVQSFKPALRRNGGNTQCFLRNYGKNYCN
ncbi:hypothetical protein GcM1_201040 [Golovinomyces cichoracearum]|uniref:Uncharacterized protein n=1 Tax=Golovinomyces cichoracearum TaxID=62708 RepID=A0A420IYF3_9PEZI|nr:hypothetical protein GcM1_201040 [Golovinomyces cichoracearum]